MKSELSILVVITAVLAAGYALAQTPSNWKTISAGKAFTFRAPSDTVPYSDGGQAIDSFVGLYRNSKFTLDFDYGLYSNDLREIRDRPGYTTNHIRIDGRAATIVSGPGKHLDGCNDHMMAVYVLVSRGSWFGEAKKLMMSGCTKDVEGMPSLRAVFESIRFSND